MKSLIIAGAVSIAALPFILDTLTEAVEYQERVVALYEENFGHISNRPTIVRQNWETQKKETLTKIEALRILTQNITDQYKKLTKPTSPFVADQIENTNTQ